MAGNWLRSVFWLFMDQGPLSQLENDRKISNFVIIELFYWRLYNNKINAHALIGQSAMFYCAGKPMEISRVFWSII